MILAWFCRFKVGKQSAIFKFDLNSALLASIIV